MYSNGGFGMGVNDMASPIRQPMATGIATNGSANGYASMNGAYSAYMMGR